MAVVSAGLTPIRTFIFEDDRKAVNLNHDRKAVNSAGGKLDGEVFSQLGSGGREFFDFVG